MIRRAHESDRETMTALWQESFSDEKRTVDAFFDSPVYGDILPLVYCEEEKVVSQLFLIEGEVRAQADIYPSYYLYAACTSPLYRGRGIMGALIEAAAETARANEKDFIFLKPGSPELYGFYSKHGFVKTRGFEVRTFTAGERNAPVASDVPVFYSHACRVLSSCFADLCEGETRCLYSSKYGYAQYEASGDALNISDIDIGPDTAGFIEYLLETHNSRFASVSLPCRSGGRGEPHGMALSCSGRAIPEGVFLNFTLD